ncbi:hypothetical protein [Pseudomonas syringae]|uniref:hypothetical protein n=1 Tax=Pseudomonas syringae TaxID=317 RepID=UPI001784D1D5|nr:hypothetical protein [Pseudomonas syringae]
MAFSLIRSLTASVVRNVSALKRDAKRLQKNSQLVFGTEYPLKVCQHAVAVSRGFRSLTDVENISRRLGLDKNAPFWTVRGRSDNHQAALSALYQLGLEYSENGPVVFTGNQRHSIVPALTLLFEEMSTRKLPGLILVETQAESVQETLVYDGVKALGFDEIYEGFRSLDLREKNLPVSLCTESRCWVSAILNAFDLEIQSKLQRTDWAISLETSAFENAKSRRQVTQSKNFHAIPFYSVKEAAYQLVHGCGWPLWIDDNAKMASFPEKLDEDTVKVLLHLIGELAERNFSLGVSCEHESSRRPYVVLFSRNDPASEVLAGVVHSYYSWRQPRENPNPILYVSDGALPYAPRFLSFGGNTVVVNGLDGIPDGKQSGQFYGYKNALKVVGSPEGLTYMGKRVSL